MKTISNQLLSLFLGIFVSLSSCSYVAAQNGTFQWAKQLPVHWLYPQMTIDSESNVYTIGNFEDTVDFDPGPGVFEMYPDKNLFIQKLDSNGNFRWVKQIGKLPGYQGQITGTGITVDKSNNISLVLRYKSKRISWLSSSLFGICKYSLVSS